MDAARVIDASIDDKSRLIVCSHSCDLQRMEGRLLAIATGRCVEDANGSLRRGMSIQTLQMKSRSGVLVNYDVETLQFVDVSILDAHQPWHEEAHDDQDRRALALWLGQRFDRLALPNSVVQPYTIPE